MASAYNTSYSGGWGRIAWTREAEVAVSQEHAITLHPGQREQNSVSKKKSVFKNKKQTNQKHQPGQHGETQSELKIQIRWAWWCVLSHSYSGGWGGWITWAREVEAAVSCDLATALQPGWWEWDPVSKKKKIRCKSRSGLLQIEGQVIPHFLGKGQ